MEKLSEVRFQASGVKLKLDIPYAELDDPARLGRDISKTGHNGTGQVEVKLQSLEELEPVLNLIEQAFQQTV